MRYKVVVGFMSFLEGFTQGGLFGSAKMPGGAKVICEETTDIEESQFRDLLKPFLASAPAKSEAPTSLKDRMQAARKARGLPPLEEVYETPAITAPRSGNIPPHHDVDVDLDIEDAISRSQTGSHIAGSRTRAMSRALLDITQGAPKPPPSDYLEELGAVLRKLEKDLKVQIRRDGAGRLNVVRRDESDQRKTGGASMTNPITRTHDK
jgi:hypothetical protein